MQLCARPVCNQWMGPKMPAFLKQNRPSLRFAAIFAVILTCQTTCVRAQEDEGSSGIFSGGLVQQLRSLTKDAFESRGDAPSRPAHSFGRVNVRRTRPRTEQPPQELQAQASRAQTVITTQRRTVPQTKPRPSKPQPRTTSVEARSPRTGIGSLQETIIPEPRTEVPQLLRNTSKSRDLPAVITPEQLLGEVPEGGDGSQYELVHVEQRLPVNVRESIRSNAQMGLGETLDQDGDEETLQTAADDDRRGYGIGSLPSSRKSALPRRRGSAARRAASSKRSDSYACCARCS